MVRFPSADSISRASCLLFWLCTLFALPGCATSAPPAKTLDSIVPVAQTLAQVEPTASSPVPVLRSGRYTLIELSAQTPQRDLLQQIVDVSFPPSVSATVGAALRYLLLQTGYQLCDTAAVKDTLDAWPLPAAHLHLGPLTLRQALEVLAGPAWTLQVQESTRQVCFVGSHETTPLTGPESPPVPATTENRS